jgi:hypothetical protein
MFRTLGCNSALNSLVINLLLSYYSDIAMLLQRKIRWLEARKIRWLRVSVDHRFTH